MKQLGTLDSIWSEPNGHKILYLTYIDPDRRQREQNDRCPPTVLAQSSPECGPSRIEPAGIKALVEEAARPARRRSRLRRLRSSRPKAISIATETHRKARAGRCSLMPATAKRFDVGDVCDPAWQHRRRHAAICGRFSTSSAIPCLPPLPTTRANSASTSMAACRPSPRQSSYVAKVVNYQLGF